jgi:hypothetical protein
MFRKEPERALFVFHFLINLQYLNFQLQVIAIVGPVLGTNSQISSLGGLY